MTDTNSYIISTNSHYSLAKDLSEKSNIPLLESNIIYFANTEIRTSISSSIRGKNIFIITSPYNDISEGHSINDYIMETYLLISKFYTLRIFWYQCDSFHVQGLNKE